MARILNFNGNSSVLTTTFHPALELSENTVCGLIGFFSHHSIPNIDVHNNLFYIGENQKPIEIPVGAYEIEDINDLLKFEYKHGEKNLDIIANYNTGKVEIKNDKDDIDFTKEKTIGSLLGFEKRILKKSKEFHTSDYPVDITPINTINIECDLICGVLVNGSPSHIIHQFSLDVPLGYKIVEKPTPIIYLPVNSTRVSSVTVKITNQNGSLINFRGEKVSVSLHLKQE